MSDDSYSSSSTELSTSTTSTASTVSVNSVNPETPDNPPKTKKRVSSKLLLAILIVSCFIVVLFFVGVYTIIVNSRNGNLLSNSSETPYAYELFYHNTTDGTRFSSQIEYDQYQLTNGIYTFRDSHGNGMVVPLYRDKIQPIMQEYKISSKCYCCHECLHERHCLINELCNNVHNCGQSCFKDSDCKSGKCVQKVCQWETSYVKKRMKYWEEPLHCEEENNKMLVFFIFARSFDEARAKANEMAVSECQIAHEAQCGSAPGIDVGWVKVFETLNKWQYEYHCSGSCRVNEDGRQIHLEEAAEWCHTQGHNTKMLKESRLRALDSYGKTLDNHCGVVKHPKFPGASFYGMCKGDEKTAECVSVEDVKDFYTLTYDEAEFK